VRRPRDSESTVQSNPLVESTVVEVASLHKLPVIGRRGYWKVARYVIFLTFHFQRAVIIKEESGESTVQGNFLN